MLLAMSQWYIFSFLGIATGSWRSTDHIKWSAGDSAHRPSDGSDNTDSESRGTDATGK